MSELLHQHEVADDAFHEIQLSGKQLVFLFMATTIVAVVIFLCGVQVGRGVRLPRSSEAIDPIAAVTPASSPARATSGSVAAPPTEAPPPPAEPPPPAKETAEDLSYAKRLQADVAPNDKVKPRAETAAPTLAAKPEAKSTEVKSAEAKPDTAAAHPAPPKEAVAKAATPPSAPTGARPGVWVVQVHALKDHSAAAALAERLSSKGYPAFVLSPAPGAPSIYRVQVGRFNDRKEAEQVARRLEKEEQFKPWISH
jgi:cell division septation protein DedD